MPERIAVYPDAGSKLGFFSWAREMVAGTAVRLTPLRAANDALPRGDGHPVLLIPGFSSGDWSVLRLQHFLARQGFRPQTAGLWYNPGPLPRLMRRLENRLIELSADGKISLVGVSLGGALARDLARRYPDRVRNVVTVCSPVRFPVISPLAPLAWALAPLYARDWVGRRHDIEKPLPMPVTAIHAIEDGVVRREDCWLEPSPGARNVIVAARHMTAECAPQGLAAVVAALVV